MCSPPTPPPTAPPCPDALSALDPRTGAFHSVATRGPLAALGGSLAVDDPAGRVDVLARNALTLLDERTGALVARLPELFAMGLTADPRSGRLYVPGATAPGAPPSLGQVGVLDGRTGALLFGVRGAQAVVLDQRHGRDRSRSGGFAGDQS